MRPSHVSQTLFMASDPPYSSHQPSKHLAIFTTYFTKQPIHLMHPLFLQPPPNDRPHILLHLSHHGLNINTTIHLPRLNSHAHLQGCKPLHSCAHLQGCDPSYPNNLDNCFLPTLPPFPRQSPPPISMTIGHGKPHHQLLTR